MIHLSSTDVFVAIAIALVSLRWNFLFRKEVIGENDTFIETYIEDPFLMMVSVFAALYLSTGQNMTRATLGMLFFMVMVQVRSMDLVRFMCAVFMMLAVFAANVHMHRIKNKRKVAGNWFARKLGTSFSLES